MKRLAKAFGITAVLILVGFGANYALDTTSGNVEVVTVDSSCEDGDPKKKKGKKGKCCKGESSCKKEEASKGCCSKGKASCKKEEAGS